MKKILILPYFGKFNNYFNLWLDSCKYNNDIDWLIITDNHINQISNNIKVINKTFEDLKSYIQKKFNFKINLETPYKLCDYKPYYGYIFEEYIKGYDFWGYCDCDLIFGDINKFIIQDIFDKYDKIFRRGHLSFIRNNKYINTNFFKYDTYKIVLTSPLIYGYDESINGYHKGFAGELIDSGYKFYEDNSKIADVDFRYYQFKIMFDKQEYNLFTYENGKTYRLYNENGKIVKEEVMYIHFQKRKMINNLKFNTDKYIICPNEFINYSEELINSKKFHYKYSLDKKGYFNKNKERKESIKRDILRILHEPKKIDAIMYRLK